MLVTTLYLLWYSKLSCTEFLPASSALSLKEQRKYVRRTVILKRLAETR
jgi:hypothetical protein